jgi:hypothetical protein
MGCQSLSYIIFSIYRLGIAGTRIIDRNCSQRFGISAKPGKSWAHLTPTGIKDQGQAVKV